MNKVSCMGQRSSGLWHLTFPVLSYWEHWSSAMWTAVWPPYCSALEPFVEPLPLHPAIHKDLLVYKSKNIFIKMLKDVHVGMAMSKKHRNKMQYMQAKAVMIAWEIRQTQHTCPALLSLKPKGCTCNNHNMRNLIIKRCREGQCVTIVVCPSLATIWVMYWCPHFFEFLLQSRVINGNLWLTLI